MNKRCWKFIPVVGLLVAMLLVATPVSAENAFHQQATQLPSHLVEPGDTWLAISLRYGIKEGVLRAVNTNLNIQRQPVIGKAVTIPSGATSEVHGKLISTDESGLNQLAAVLGESPWKLALSNELPHPYRPLLFKPVLVRDKRSTVRQFPVGIENIELSQQIARPGEALAVSVTGPAVDSLKAELGSHPISLSIQGTHAVGIFGTGAFFPPGEYVLNISSAGMPSWSQPWLFTAGDWTFDNITLTGSAAAIDAESIQKERERLSLLWAEFINKPLWDSPFQPPIDEFLSISSEYGARRSYNGGPYSSYHEGLDFSAYGGTPVYAPASGRVVLAEQLYVRGGTVIINHGLGIFSGMYHQDEVLVEAGQDVVRGQMIGKVGSTGLSTGNHLHWDLLVESTWVDPQAWLDYDVASWVLNHWSAGTEATESTQ